MLIKPAIQALLAFTMVSAAVADEATENAPAAGSLPINYGKCYRIQKQDRPWMARWSTGYQGWHFDLQNSDVYKICQYRDDGNCRYDSPRAVNSKEDFFIWAFEGYRAGTDGNLLVANNPPGYFFASYGGHRQKIFHFQGTADGNEGTTPPAMDIGGHNGLRAHGIRNDDGYWPISTADDSSVRLWFHEWECPEESS